MEGYAHRITLVQQTMYEDDRKDIFANTIGREVKQDFGVKPPHPEQFREASTNNYCIHDKMTPKNKKKHW